MNEKTNNLVAKHARKYNKSAVHKDRKKAMKKGERKHKGQYENIDEVLKVSDGVAAWIKDFQQSDAPQFKGKSMDKRKEMALAAYLDAKKGSKEEQVDEWSCNQTERTRRVKGGDKRKKYMKEREVKQDADIKDREGSQPAKYHKGLSKSTKKSRDAHFKKGAEMDDDNPKAYKPAPGDADAKTKPSKFTKKAKQMYGEDAEISESAAKGLANKAEKSGMPVSILRKVYNRGKAAWRTGHRPGTTPDQWAMARVNSFITKSSGTWGKADADLARQVKGTKESVQEGKELHIRMDNFSGPEEKKVLDILRKHEVKGNITYTGETDKGIIFDIKKPAMLNGINRELKKASVSRAILEGPCWDTHKKVGTKIKNGKVVNDCVPKNEGKFDVKANMVRKNDATQFVKQAGKGFDQNRKDTMAALKDIQKRKKMRESIEEGMDHWIVKMPDQPGVKGKRNVPVKARTSREAIMKAAKRLGVDWKSVEAQAVKEGTSAQDRLDRMAAKHGLGKPNKAADDYLSKMMKKYGAKDMADLKKKMGMKEDVNENFRTLATKGMGAEKKSDIKVGSFVDYYDSKQGDKHSGEIVKMGPRNYQVKDEVTGKVHTFNYYDPTKARKLMKESNINELTQRELDMMAKRKQSNLVKRGKAKPEPKKPRQKDQSAGRTTVKQGEDDHIVMQLRKAQDVKGNMDIKVTPTGKTVRLPATMIDKLLKKHDSLQKPDEKRKFRILVTKELRKRAK